MTEQNDKQPVPASPLKQHLPRRLWVTGLLLASALFLGFFLLATRDGIEAPPWFVGAWHATVTHPMGGDFEETLDLRMTGAQVSGTASYRGVRKVIEQVEVHDDLVRFETRTHERSRSTLTTVVMRYTIKPHTPDSLRVEVAKDGTVLQEATLVFVAERR